MTAIPQGQDAIMVALANTATLYLSAEIDQVNSAWHDPSTVPALAHVRKVFSERREQVPDLPALVFGSLGQTQIANAAYGPGVGWGAMDYEFEAVLWFRSDKLHIGERTARRYAEAIWSLFMKHQDLDGSLYGPCGVDLKESRTRYGSDGGKAIAQLTFAVGWRGVVHIDQNV